MDKKDKLQRLLKVFTPDSTKIDFSNFDNEINKLKDSLKEKIQVKTLEDVNTTLEQNRKKINFEPLLTEFNSLKQNLTDQNNQVNSQLVEALDNKLKELSNTVSLSNQQANLGDEGLKNQICQLNAEIAILSARKVEIPDFGKQIKDTEIKLMGVIQTAKEIDELQDEKNSELTQSQLALLEKALKDLKQQFHNRGGGSMNRQIFINGADPLTRYTDINLKAGANVTITYVNNNQTKKVDITLSSSGGGGGGNARSINSISVNTNAAFASNTDYVYLCTGTLTLTLPDATAGNTNLYTIKNVGTGVVTVATTSSQTIDGALTQVMNVQFTSIDVVSDTSNWSIT